MKWIVYILECADKTFYTGITNNLSSRVKAHNEKKGAKYTACRLPVKVIYSEESKNRSTASKREYAIKKMSRIKKQSLINKNNDLLSL